MSKNPSEDRQHQTARAGGQEPITQSDAPSRATTATLHAQPGSATALERAQLAAEVAADNRGRDIVILDMRELTTMFDFFVLVTGASRRQLHAISDEIEAAMKRQWHDRRIGLEGFEESRWILLDFGDLVIHVFDDETRRYYALEDLWSHAKRVPCAPPAAKTSG